MYSIPDKFGRNRYCNFCYKPLTILPVKSYEDLKQKCGRCFHKVPNDANWRQATLSDLERSGLHKCLNRFDGCRHVLLQGQVASHEFVCKPQYYVCPVCPHRPTIPTFFTMIHFLKDHEIHILKNEALFKVDLTIEGSLYYLYPVGDNLFFLKYHKLYGDSFSLNTYFVGTIGLDDTLQKFKVNFDDSSNHETSTERICYFSKMDQGGFEVQKPSPECRYATVQAYLNLRGLELALASKCLNKHPSTVCLPRTILLIDNKSLIFSADSHTVKVWFSGQNLFIDMYCMICNAAVSVQQAVFAEVEPPDKFHAVCSNCRGYSSSESPDTRFMVSGVEFPDLSQLSIMYSCAWKFYFCQQLLPPEMLDFHETTCVWQPPWNCPVRGCDHKATLSDLEIHFVNNHPGDCICVFSRVLNLSESPSATVTRCYMFALHGFVTVEVSPWDLDGFYRVFFRRQDFLETFGKPQAHVLIHDREYDSYILLKENFGTTFEVGTEIQVRCYFK